MKLLTIKQAAEQLQVSGQTIGRMIAEGTLPAILLRSGKRKRVWRVREEVLERWLLQREKQAGRDIAGSRGTPPNNGKHDLSQTNGGQRDAEL
ncbi:MAG: helix-turn-helix domain-containing protein [bacterium]|nr:helix-turn-helix domain-containing protein [bacterium]